MLVRLRWTGDNVTLVTKLSVMRRRPPISVKENSKWLLNETHGSEFIFNHTVQPVFKRSESRFMRVLWPSMQTHMLKYARLAQQSIISHSLAHVSQEELSKSERDARNHV